MRFLQPLWGIIAAGVGLTACSSQDIGPAHVSDDGLWLQSKQDGAEKYPKGPYGTSVGDVVANYSFSGKRDANDDSLSYDDALQTIQFADYHAKVGAVRPKVLMVSVCAEWCGPCQNEEPKLVELWKDYESWAPGMVKFLSVLAEDAHFGPGNEASVNRWGKRFGIPFDLAFDPNAAPTLFAFASTPDEQAFPFHLLIETRKMVLAGKGAIDVLTLRDEIDQILAAGPQPVKRPPCATGDKLCLATCTTPAPTNGCGDPACTPCDPCRLPNASYDARCDGTPSACACDGVLTHFVCDSPFIDCNGNPSDGCEARIVDCPEACPSGKACFGDCASATNPATGCGSPSCAPCDLPNAYAECGPNAENVSECRISGCQPGWSDADADPADGCETWIGGSCVAMVDQQSCFACCESAHPGQALMNETYTACLCDSDHCGAACGDNFCAGGTVTPACATCANDDTSCNDAANSACAADPECALYRDCVIASACYSK